jgi:multiple sugar transport system substrate-binding protein
MYQQAFDAFTVENPQIKVNASLLSWADYWDKRKIEAAGGNLPDVMQWDYQYMREYAANGKLLDLAPYLGSTIVTDGISSSLLPTGEVDGTQFGIPIGGNTYALFINSALLKDSGVDAYPGGGTWEQYTSWLASVSSALQPVAYGGADWTRNLENFQHWLRAQGKSLFTEDGKPGFTKEDLTAFWNLGVALREAGGAVPADRAEEALPKSPLGAGLGVAETQWDNFSASFAADLGVDATDLSIVAPPTAAASARDLYMKPSMLHVIAKNTKHPDQAAKLVDFLINSPQVGEIFGTNRGLPASQTQRDGLVVSASIQAMIDYEASVAFRIGEPPLAPVVGYGTIATKYLSLSTDLGLGVVKVTDAVNQFFDEMNQVLG